MQFRQIQLKKKLERIPCLGLLRPTLNVGYPTHALSLSFPRLGKITFCMRIKGAGYRPTLIPMGAYLYIFVLMNECMNE